MKGDFTRNTFDPMKQFTRVLMQQGRVQLDADWNEQVAILLHYLQTLAADLIGPHGGPAPLEEDGEDSDHVNFNIKPVAQNNVLTELEIGPGHYYVDGILCETEGGNYLNQQSYPEPPPLPDLPFLVYLDVWERFITAIEDDSIREVALNGADTAARAKIISQMKLTHRTSDGQPIPPAPPPLEDGTDGDWSAWIDEQWPNWRNQWQPENRGQMKAQTKDPDAGSEDACITPPEARYRGAENQLYRVEIHQGSLDADGNQQQATFKWSRDNGSVIFPIRRLSGTTVIVEHLGRDTRFSLQEGDWVEIVDDDYSLRGEVRDLVKVEAIDRGEMTLTLADDPDVNFDETGNTHPLLRRWDGYGKIVESGADDEKWLALEDGIEIQFQKPETGEHTYRIGDYWLIPARTATGDVEWPQEWDTQKEKLVAKAVRPHGVAHHYAPLAIVVGANDDDVKDLRRLFQSAGEPVSV